MAREGRVISLGDRTGSHLLIRLVIWLCGALTAVAGLFALYEAFSPTIIYPGGFYQSCGSPALFDRHKITESMLAGQPSPPGIIDLCEQDAQDHVLRAVGASAVCASLAILWRLEVMWLHRRRA